MKNRTEIAGRDAFSPNVQGPPLVIERKSDQAGDMIFFQTFVPELNRPARERILLIVKETDLRQAMEALGWKL